MFARCSAKEPKTFVPYNVLPPFCSANRLPTLTTQITTTSRRRRQTPHTKPTTKDKVLKSRDMTVDCGGRFLCKLVSCSQAHGRQSGSGWASVACIVTCQHRVSLSRCRGRARWGPASGADFQRHGHSLIKLAKRRRGVGHPRLVSIPANNSLT